MKSPVAFAILLVIIGLAFFFWRFLLARGMRTVVAIFRAHKAVDSERAAPLAQLGLVGRKGSLGTNMFGPRDYKQTGMRMMGQEGVIKTTDGEKFYLDENALATSRIKRFAGIK
jgi:hypothetical protein